MMSKSLYSNISLIWDMMRRKIGVLVISCLVFPFALPIFLTISLQNAHWQGANTTEISYILNEIFSPCFGFINLLMIFFGLFVGLVFFHYLHKRKLVDFYHSLPLTRTKLFLSQYLAGACTVILPYIVFYFIAMGVAALFGDLGLVRKLCLLQGLCYPLLIFLALYSVTVLAGILTGNLVIQGGVALYLLFIVPVILGEISLLMSSFFYTYAGEWALRELLLPWCSPVLHAFLLVDANQVASLSDFLFYLGVISVSVVLALCLYQKRRSEAAQKPLAFPFFAPLVKYPLIICGSLGLGLQFYTLSVTMNLFWLFLGAALGCILVSRTIEVILVFDFKAVKKRGLTMVFSMVAVCSILLVFVFDIGGYDRYLPQQSEVVAVNIEVASLNLYGEGHSDYVDENSYYSAYPLGDRTKLTREKEIAAALALAKSGIAQIPSRAKQSVGKTVESGTSTTAKPASLRVRYTLHNGLKATRYYEYIDKEETLAAVETLIASREFKENQLGFLDRDDVMIGYFQYLDTGVSLYQSDLSEATQRKILQAYRTEADSLSVEEAKNKKVVAVFTVENKEEVYGNNGNYVHMTVPVYEHYQKTLAALAETKYPYASFGVLNSDYIDKMEAQYYSSAAAISYYYTDGDFPQGQNDIMESEEVNATEVSSILRDTVPFESIHYHYFLDYEDINQVYFATGTLSADDFVVKGYRSKALRWTQP